MVLSESPVTIYGTLTESRDYLWYSLRPETIHGTLCESRDYSWYSLRVPRLFMVLF